MNSKKAITLLVLATLMLSLFPISTVYSALDTGFDDVYEDDGITATTGGRYGETIIIKGLAGSVTAGKYVKVYWDAVEPWDGETGLLNSTKAKSNGAYELWFDVPSALNGAHYLWLEDANTGQTYMITTAFTVTAKVKLSPTSGLQSDTITMKGYGFGEEVDIIWVRLFNRTAGTCNKTLTTTPTAPETNELGYWTASFKVPKVSDGYWYHDYNVSAKDDELNRDNASFTIGPSVTLNVEEGPVGTVVRASGRGFESSGALVNVRINGGGNSEKMVEVDEDDLDTSSNGEFTCEFVIPAVIDADEYELYFEDTTGNIGTADFEVLGLPEIDTYPGFGIQGSTVSIEGWNFTAISGEDVDIYVTPQGDDPILDGTKVKTLETESDGTFSGTFKLPGLASATYEVWALQGDWGVNNTIQATDGDANFKIGLMIVILSPESGPSGALVSLTASGFEDGGEWNATLGDEVIEDSGAVAGDGSINQQFWIPSMDPGVYTMTVLDVDNDIEVTAEFEVTDRTRVQTDPLVAPNTYNVTIEGYFFAESPNDPDLDFVLYNETDDWDLTVTYVGSAVELEDDDDWDDGYFMGYWKIPASTQMSIGTYTMNVTDGEGMFAQYVFNIVDKTVEIEPRKRVFRIGETVAFNVESSFASGDSYIKIWDPSGSLYWKTNKFAADDWVKVGTLEVYPYFAQIASGNLMTLLDDAPLGTWTWTWYDVEDEELDAGTFTVEAAAADVIGQQVQDLANEITDLATQLSAVSDEFSDVKSDIADVAAIAQQAVTAAQQAAEAVQTVAQTANQANTAAENAKTAAEAARDAANSLTTLVYGAIGAALVAALAAIVSLMQISRRIAG